MPLIETLDYEKTAALLPKLSDSENAAVLFLESENYYQKGKQYVGPPAAMDDLEGQRYIEQSFVPLAKLGELTRRYVAGAVGQEPAFETVDEKPITEGAAQGEAAKPSQAKQLADSSVGAWWDNERMAETLEVFTSRLVSSNRAYFHYGVPPGFVRDFTDAAGSVVSAINAADFQDALELIYCEVPDAGTAFVYTDSSIRQKYGIYSYAEPDPADSTKTIKCIEVSWCPTRDADGNKIEPVLTQVRILKDDKSAPQSFVLDTGGVPLVVEAKFHPLVFSPVASDANIRLNNVINSDCTMVKINTDVAGFPEKNHVDIATPVIDTGRKDDSGKPIYEDADAMTGPRTAPFHMSVVDESKDDKGSVTRSARGGTIIYRNPVSSDPLLEVIRFFLRELYTAANQAHVLEALSPDSSGVARIEARADFARALLKIARKVEGSLRDVLRGVRCLAAYVAQEQLEEMKALRDNVTCHPNSGPLSPDEKRLILEEVAAEVISRKLAMTMLGVEDLDAELNKIQEERNLRDFGERNPTAAGTIVVGTIDKAVA